MATTLVTTPPYSARNETRVLDVPLDWIEPSGLNPRKRFDEAALQELADSIREHGLLEPIVVRELAPDRYGILAGERRWRACSIAGLENVPVHIKEGVDDVTALRIALDVRPGLPVDDSSNGRAVDAILPTKGTARDSLSSCLADISYIRLGELRPAAVFALLIDANTPPFLVHVVHVVLRRSQEEVVRPNTSPIVAAVADKKTFRDRSVVQFPRDAMGQKQRSAFPASAHAAVCAAAAGPVPASVAAALVHILPEALAHRFDSVLALRERAQVMELYETMAGRDFPPATTSACQSRFHLRIIPSGVDNMQQNAELAEVV